MADEPMTNRRRGALSGHIRRMQGPAPNSRDPFAEADAINRAKAQAAELENLKRKRNSRRDNLPLLPGGLFDETRRGEQDMWS